MDARRALLAVFLVAPLLSCRAPDPQAVLEVSGIEAYWAIDPPSGDTRYIAPAARLYVKNKGTEALRSVQATATFRRKGEAQTWGSDWQQVSTTAKPLAPGQTALVLLKSDARYSSPVEPEAMFTHQLFKDARVEIFLRVGSSAWSKFGDADVARHIGSRSLETAPGAPSPAAAATPAPGPSASAAPAARPSPRAR
jgi:hypothetical protein